MRIAASRVWLAVICGALVSFPLMALAQAAGASVSAPFLGIGWPAVLAVAGVVASLVSQVVSFLPPGIRSYVALASGAVAEAVSSLTSMSQAGETVTTFAVISALVAAALGRARAGRPAMTAAA